MLVAKQKKTKRNEREKLVMKEKIEYYSGNITKKREKRKKTKTNKK